MALESPVTLGSTQIGETEMIESKETTIDVQEGSWSVEGALKSFGLPTADKPPTTPLAFFHLIGRLKTTPREGWRRFGIAHAESIAEHMYRMGVATSVLPDAAAARLDVARCTRMALYHDMAEALVGDITPVDGVSKAEKRRRETATIEYIAAHLLAAIPDGGERAARELRAGWQEYEDDETDEAHLVHDVDKLELLLQMNEYEAAHADASLDLGEFCWVAEKVRTPEMKRWCADVMRERAAFWRGRGNKAQGLDLGEKIIAEDDASRR